MLLKKIVLAEDDDAIAHLVGATLGDAGFLCLRARDGDEALQLVKREAPDLLVLDVMMPKVDGLEVCRRLKADVIASRIPVLMLTSLGGVENTVKGLEAGADDYLSKPFSPRELVARVRALLRRSSGSAGTAEVIRRGDLVIDVPRHEVTLKEKPVLLTATEFRILQFLASRPGRVCSRTDIIDDALGPDVAVIDRTVDVHVTAIRRKLGKGADLIETIRGFGYKFREVDRAARGSKSATGTR